MDLERPEAEPDEATRCLQQTVRGAVKRLAADLYSRGAYILPRSTSFSSRFPFKKRERL